MSRRRVPGSPDGWCRAMTTGLQPVRHTGLRPRLFERLTVSRTRCGGRLWLPSYPRGRRLPYRVQPDDPRTCSANTTARRGRAHDRWGCIAPLPGSATTREVRVTSPWAASTMNDAQARPEGGQLGDPDRVQIEVLSFGPSRNHHGHIDVEAVLHDELSEHAKRGGEPSSGAFRRATRHQWSVPSRW
jgi:hypothetical protein